MTAPHTERDDVVETLHGHEISDPYRWLEDPDSERTRAWVEAQRAHCEEAFADIPERAWFTETMNTILRQPRASAPWRSNGWYLRLLNDGHQDQDVLVGARSLQGLLESPRTLLDPNTWSEDGTTSLAFAQVSPDGTLLAHGISAVGSDWTTVKVLDLKSDQLLEDEIITKHCVPHWLPDSSGFTWSRYAEAGRAEGTETAATSEEHLMVHRLGDEPTESLDLLSFPDDPRRMFQVQVFAQPNSDDGWLVATPAHGTNRSNALWAARITHREQRTEFGDWVQLFDDEDHMRWPLGVVGDELICLTDTDAPRHRVVAWTLTPAPAMRVIVEQSESTLEDAALSDGVLVVTSLEDAQPRIDRWSLHGEHLGRVEVDGGAVVALSAEPEHGEVFLGLSSVTQPTVSWRLEADSGHLTPIRGADRTWTPPTVEVTRHRATSQDGTQVPYFLIRPVGAPEGLRPTLLYGYGGFSIPVLAGYRAGWAGWLAAGGNLVIANLRGGGEFGTDWYEQGKTVHKHNVFDDFNAIAEHLIVTGRTTSSQLASYGRSNGGLLVGATMTQRPDLYAAAIPQVGVLDLLRFHLFTIGAAWISDYGNPEVREDFETALSYSPLHNVHEGVSYPPTLVVTGDHDDRVVPAHSHKFTATLQAAQPDDPQRPILTRIESATGHGAGKPISLQAAEWADVLAFAAHHTGLSPR